MCSSFEDYTIKSSRIGKFNGDKKRKIKRERMNIYWLSIKYQILDILFISAS